MKPLPLPALRPLTGEPFRTLTFWLDTQSDPRPSPASPILLIQKIGGGARKIGSTPPLAVGFAVTSTARVSAIVFASGFGQDRSS